MLPSVLVDLGKCQLTVEVLLYFFNLTTYFCCCCEGYGTVFLLDSDLLLLRDLWVQ